MRISVGLPVYNGADYLPAALDSILSQEEVDFELVVSEGGSTDATPTILREYAARDTRVRYLPALGRLAQAENWNSGCWRSPGPSGSSSCATTTSSSPGPGGKYERRSRVAQSSRFCLGIVARRCSATDWLIILP